MRLKSAEVVAATATASSPSSLLLRAGTQSGKSLSQPLLAAIVACLSELSKSLLLSSFTAHLFAALSAAAGKRWRTFILIRQANRLKEGDSATKDTLITPLWRD